MLWKLKAACAMRSMGSEKRRGAGDKGVNLQATGEKAIFQNNQKHTTIIHYPSRIRPNSTLFVGECCSKSYHWATARPPWCCGRGNLQAPHRAMRLRQSWLRRRCTSRISWGKTMGSRSLGVKAQGGPMDSWTCPKKTPVWTLRIEIWTSVCTNW